MMRCWIQDWAHFKTFLTKCVCTDISSLCTLTNKAVGTISRDLSKPPQRRQGPDHRLLWLLVGTPSVLGPELASTRAEHSLLWQMFNIYCWYTIFISVHVCVIIFMASPLWLAVGPRVFIGRIIYKFLNVCPFDCTTFGVSGKVGIP